ncbi:hypothetical protein [Kaistella sp.]|uniref:hypothetical protein n=1 Tax=Kaistella sp. TaxID=2782235 RepID=UPI00359F3F0D
MKNKISFLFLFLFLLFFKGQDINKLSGLSNDYLKEEIRIYKDRGITNSGLIFRIYKENKVWNAESIQWFLPTEISSDEFKTVRPNKIDLSFNRNIELIFMNLDALNIGVLPMEDAFQYKKDKKSVVWDDDENQYLLQIKKVEILDGTSYSVIYHSNEKYNEFTYNNPESYLQKFPEIDELSSFVEILKYIRKEFKIDF